MFACRKFLSLDERGRLRHLWRWLKDAEALLAAGAWPDALVQQLEELSAWLAGEPDPVWAACAGLLADLRQGPPAGGLRQLGSRVNHLHHQVAGIIGAEAAEWDLREGLWQSPAQVAAGSAGTGEVPPPQPAKGCRVFLDDVRSPYNVGSIFRTAEVFGFIEVILSPCCPDLGHPRLARSAMGCVQRVPHRVLEFADLWTELEGQPDGSGGLFALELGGSPLGGFRFPSPGTVVLGNEELGINPAILEACAASAGRVSIPMRGSKASLNVAVSFGILAHAWVFG